MSGEPNPELLDRIATLERDPGAQDFDRSGWAWLVLFGIAVPLALIVLGWWL